VDFLRELRLVFVFIGCTRLAGSDYPMDTKFLTLSGMLKNGLRHGPFTVYFPQTGKPARQGTYKMNEYDGELTTWRPDGMKVVQTYKNGVANGWQKNYNSQGALMGEIMMKNGRATGEFRAYDSRGNIVQEGTHEDNVVSTVKGMSSPRPEPNEVSPNDNGGIMIKEVNE